MHDLKNLKCLLPNTETVLLKMVDECSLNVLEGINFKLFSVAILYTDDIDDDNIGYLEPIEVVSKEKIRDFFERELNK